MWKEGVFIVVIALARLVLNLAKKVHFVQGLKHNIEINPTHH